MKSKMRSPGYVIAFLMAAITFSTISCDDFLDPGPQNYPARFTFSGYVFNTDSLALNQIRVILKTPNNLDSVTVLTDTNGFYYFKHSLEFVGPNQLIARDIDGSANGGTHYPTDTVFYISQDQYDIRRVETNFVLQLQ